MDDNLSTRANDEASVLPSFSSASSGPALFGDYYREDDNVTRSVPAVPSLPEEVFGSFGTKPIYDLYGGLAEVSKFNHHFSSEQRCREDAEVAEGEFSDSVRPSMLNDDEASTTSLRLGSCSAAKAMNTVRRWLENKVGANLTKVRLQKFALNADVFQDLVCCQQHTKLKVRAFRIPTQPGARQEVLVDFRRLRGDAVAFNHAFHEASQLLRDIDPAVCCPKHVAPGGGTQIAIRQALAAVPAPTEDACADCQPLLDMMANHSSPSAQAEAVAALAALANANAAGAVAVCAALVRAQEALVGLLAGAARTQLGIDIAYPAALLFTHLIRQGGAEGFELERLLLAALEGIAADDTAPIVRLELAAAVREATQRYCSAGYREPFAQDLRSALVKTSCKPICASVQGSLQEALCALQVS